MVGKRERVAKKAASVYGTCVDEAKAHNTVHYYLHKNRNNSERPVKREFDRRNEGTDDKTA